MPTTYMRSRDAFVIRLKGKWESLNEWPKSSVV